MRPIPAASADGAGVVSAHLTDPREFWRGVTYAAPGLDAFLDRELARYALPPSKLALVGFSQGAMMALHLGLRRRDCSGGHRRLFGPAGAGGRSGTGQPQADGAGRSRRSCSIHGDQDDVVPVEMFFFSKEALGRRGDALPMAPFGRRSATASTRRRSGMAAFSGPGLRPSLPRQGFRPARPPSGRLGPGSEHGDVAADGDHMEAFAGELRRPRARHGIDRRELAGGLRP